MSLLYFAIGTLIGGLIGFVNTYMNKKGENLATHEDIDKLVDQVRAVTQTAKEIETKISSDLWDRQKQWELKRDILASEDLLGQTALPDGVTAEKLPTLSVRGRAQPLGVSALARA